MGDYSFRGLKTNLGTRLGLAAALPLHSFLENSYCVSINTPEWALRYSTIQHHSAKVPGILPQDRGHLVTAKAWPVAGLWSVTSHQY